MDWSNTAHLLQVMLVCICVVMLVIGFNAGNRL